MTLIWRDQFSVGNDTINNDHKRLIEIINKIQSSLVANNRDDVLKALEELRKFSASCVERGHASQAIAQEYPPNFGDLF